MITKNEAAARAFIAAMRREWLKLNSHYSDLANCPIRDFDGYSAEHKTALIRSLSVAIEATSEESMNRLNKRLAEKASQKPS